MANKGGVRYDPEGVDQRSNLAYRPTKFGKTYGMSLHLHTTGITVLPFTRTVTYPI